MSKDDYEIDNEDKSVYQQAMDENASLRAQLAEKDKKIELIKSIADNLSYELKVVNQSFNSEHRVAELFRIRAEKAEAENAELQERLKAVGKVNIKYNSIMSTLPDAVIKDREKELWEAIKKAVRK